MPKVTGDGVAIEVRAGSGRLNLFAWLVIVLLSIGAAANAFSLATGDPAYTPQLWFTFFLLKLVGVIAGVMLLKGRRLGFWLLAASFALGLVVVAGSTGPYPAWQWIAAAAVAAMLFGGGWLAIRRDWPQSVQRRAGN